MNIVNLKAALKILEISSFTGADDVRSAFRRLAHRWHPDKNPDSHSAIKFRELVEAYEFLKDHLPDVYRHFSLNTPSKTETMPEVAAVIENLDDIFDDIFGFSKSGRVLGYQEPQDLEIQLGDFFSGARLSRTLTAYQKCSDCQGLGAREGFSTKICRYCFGKGRIQVESGLSQGCAKCGGRGRQIAKPCSTCNGFGRLKCREKLDVVIPVGLRPGQMYTLTATQAKTGRNFEIFINPILAPHGIFQIENYDLVCEYPVDFATVHAGDVIFVTTPLGEKKLTLPQGFCDGMVLKILGAGLYKDVTKKTQGDLRVVLRSERESFWRGIWRLFWKK